MGRTYSMYLGRIRNVCKISIGRSILVDLGHRWDFSRTALNLKVEGC